MIRQIYNPVVGPVTTGTQTDPDTSTVMADTGALGAGRYEARVSIGASASALFALQRRNAANDSSEAEVVLRVPGNASAMFIFTFDCRPAERLRVMMATGLTGDAESTLQIEKLG